MFDTHTGRGINSNLDYANQQLTEEWQKLFLKNKVYSSFNRNIWDAGFSEIQLMSKYHKGI